MSAVCASCGQQNRDGAVFCDGCGTKLAGTCSACGTDNRPEARFCQGCGTRLDESVAGGTPAPISSEATPPPTPETAAERRLVSVLFADLVAFTSYSEGRDPELVRETLTRYFEAAREVIERHGGVVEKFIGDAVMAEWGAPRTNEDDAERAVRAALEVVEAVRNLGEDLHARVAVLTGQAAVTIGATDQGIVAGDLVNTAARLQGVAPPDTVLVGEATMQAASGAITFEEAGEQTLKGKEAPVPSWRAVRVVGDTQGRGRGEGLEPPFVGRELELRLLKDLVNAASQERRPRLVSITGPAGIGKSRLAWEFEKYVDGLVETIYWHRGRSPSYGEGIAFWALGEMVRRRARLVESDDEATTRERIKMVVGEFVDASDRAWVERALLTLLGLEPPPPGGRDALFAAWRTFFERVAARSTTVLIFEDLHWADDGQLDFIDHLLEWSRDVPLLVITLARPDLLERRPGWGTGARSFNAIGLEPLTDANMRELLTSLVPELPDSAVEQVLARADGIPLYAVETVRSLISDGRLVPDSGGSYRPTGDLGELAIPDTLRALVASRLDALDTDDRSLVQDATVLGQTFDHRALAYIAGVDREEVEIRLRALVKRELLEMSVDPRSPERGQYGFVQSIIREVAYGTLSRRDRRARHLAAARYYEAEGDEELAAALATHYLAAYQASDEGPEADALRVQARLALRGAADRAMDLGSTRQALTHLEVALEITDDPAERGQLLSRASEAAAAAAALTKAGSYARAAMEAFTEAGEERSALTAAGLLGSVLLDNDLLDEAATLLEGSAERAEAYPEIHADLLSRLARAYMRLTRDEEAVRTADQAIVIAESRLLDRIVAEAMINKGSALMKLGRLREPRMLLEVGADLAHEVGDFDLELRGRANLSVTLMMQDVDAATALREEIIELATRLGSHKHAIYTKAQMASTEGERGLDWDGGIAVLDELLEETQEPSARASLLSGRMWYRVKRGEDWQDLWAEVERLRADLGEGQDLAYASLVRAEAQLYEGRSGEALETTRGAMPHLKQLGDIGAVVLLMVGAARRDLAIVREAEAQMQDLMLGNVDVGTRAWAAAVHASIDGRTEDAIAQFNLSVDRFRVANWRYWVAYVQLTALRLLPGEPALEGWAEDARARFELLGAVQDLRLLDEALAAREATRRTSDTVTAAETPAT